ncbi:MAG: hypothetical protein PHF14_03065 [Verrucomicrobiota bacterium]|jgi:hypothetical protein|nr:hypothetical protein [Verrucomicrobiota bacterium]MDD8045424.1 hypothetical protein [Verrucomicrobiota bacterium]MDD8050564.1 hypothetical protein [Verrucomicrobiota bacterium]
MKDVLNANIPRRIMLTIDPDSDTDTDPDSYLRIQSPHYLLPTTHYPLSTGSTHAALQ